MSNDTFYTAVDNALQLALEALIEVEYEAVVSNYDDTSYECAWCESSQGDDHLESCARHKALVAIHEARVQFNGVER